MVSFLKKTCLLFWSNTNVACSKLGNFLIHFCQAWSTCKFWFFNKNSGFVLFWLDTHHFLQHMSTSFYPRWIIYQLWQQMFYRLKANATTIQRNALARDYAWKTQACLYSIMRQIQENDGALVLCKSMESICQTMHCFAGTCMLCHSSQKRQCEKH